MAGFGYRGFYYGASSSQSQQQQTKNKTSKWNLKKKEEWREGTKKDVSAVGDMMKEEKKQNDIHKNT